MSRSPGPSHRRRSRSFWLALGITVTPFVVTPFVVEAWFIEPNTDLRALSVGAASAMVLTGLAVLALVVGLGTLKARRSVGLGVLAGLAVGVVGGGVSCLAAISQAE